MTEPQRAVLVGVDGTDRGDDATALARELAELRGARLVAGAVYRREFPVYPGSDAYEADLRDIAEHWLEGAVGSGKFAVEKRTVRATSPARGLHELAEAIGAEFIVVGSTHRASAGRVHPGSVGERLLQESPCAVAVAPRGYASWPHDRLRVLAVGYDLTEESEAALELAAEVAGAAEGTLRILTVDESRTERYADLLSGAVAESPPTIARERLKMIVMRKRDSLPVQLRADAQILHGRPAAELLNELVGVDLMLMGSRGYGTVGRALLGSVAAEVVRAAPCPIVIVPRSVARRAHEKPSADASGAVA
jgi:nucleotide-binding universal stress UspA family protein